MTLLHDAYTALLSGLTTKIGNEIHWQDEYGKPITIEPVDIEKEKYIVRYYHENGNKKREREYQSGKTHGKSIGWDISGKKWAEQEYQNGQFHGKSVRWFNGGEKASEEEYQNGLLHGKSIEWYADGNKLWEAEYQNGVRIK